MRNFNSSIRIKLLLAGLSIIIGLGFFIFVAVIFFYQLNQEDVRVQIAAGKIMEYTLKVRKAEKDHQLRDLTNIQFFETGNSKNLDIHTEAINSLKDTIASIQKLNKQTFNENLKKLNLHVEAYKAAFLELMNTYREMGFKDYGVLGTLRKAANGVESNSKT